MSPVESGKHSLPAWRKNFIVVWCANFLTAIGMLAFLPLFPLHLREMGVTDEGAIKIWSGALVAATPLTAALMGPIWGAIGDRVGRKPMMLRANAAIALFVALMWLAHDPWLLLVLRLVQGGFSGFIAPAMTLVSVGAPPERQGRVAGLLHTSVLGGNILGPYVGGRVGDAFSHRDAFLVCAALSLIALLLIRFFVVEPKREMPAPAATGLRKASVPVLQHAFAELKSFLEPGPLRSMVSGVFAVRVSSVLVDPVLALFVADLAGAGPDNLGTTTGVVFAATAVATLIVTPAWGRVGDTYGHGRLLTICALGSTACLAPQAFVHHVAQLWALRFANGIFLAGILPSAYGLAAKLSPVERRGAANGFMFSSIGLASAVGPMTGGFLAAHLGLRPLFGVAAGLMLLGACWLAWLRRQGLATPPGSKLEAPTPFADPPS